jgi:gliding motility-associated-like protein
MDASKWKTTTAAPGVQFLDKSTIGGGGKIETWDWSFGDVNNSTSTIQHPYFEYPIDDPQDTGLFLVSLMVTSEDGCCDTISRPFILNPDITVFIPNAFTPNNYGELRNNRFFVVADGFQSFNISIFNRWGEELYYSENINDGWDGNYKSNPAQQDVYVYVVRVTSFSGKEYEYYGTVMLLR